MINRIKRQIRVLLVSEVKDIEAMLKQSLVENYLSELLIRLLLYSERKVKSLFILQVVD
jgi:hypothetical protein